MFIFATVLCGGFSLKTIRILGIAPYEGLRNLLEQVAGTRENLELHTIIADKSEALDYIADLDETQFDAIISRGGTATSISELVSIPVFDILLSYYDIFNILKLAESLNEQYCIVCYPSLAEKAGRICRVLDYDVKTYVTNTWEESRAMVDKAIGDGYEMILGDVSACRFASSRNVGNMLITTGIETVEEVFDRISSFFLYYGKTQNENVILRNYVTLKQELLLVYDSSENMIYSSVNDISVFIKTETRKMIADVRRNGAQTVTRRYNRRSYIISASPVTIRGESCCQFQVEFKDNLPKSLSGSISIMTDDSERTRFFSYLYNSTYYKHIREQVSFLSDSSLPVMLAGPRSVCKEDIVRTIFGKSRNRNRTLYFIDCQALSITELEELIDSHSSPLHENNCTFCFNHAQAMDLNMIRHLIPYFFASDFHKRNRVIFSWQTGCESASGDDGMTELVNKVGCTVLDVPSLRQMAGVIPKLAALYINDLNADFSRQLFGISPEAATLLQGYDWPFNLDQLRRVIRDSYQMTDEPYISADSIRQVLEQERRQQYISTDLGSEHSLTGTLDMITRRIVNQVYKEENYNQSKTAARLGISRTTLWRMLKE